MKLIEIGQKFGKLTVEAFVCRKVTSSRKSKVWKLRCECGNEVIKTSSDLSRRDRKFERSCGCYEADKEMPRLSRRHGLYKHPNYNSWRCMMSRCYRANDINYKDYAGRGIKVCARWHDFNTFIDDMGVRPEGYTLNRIDNDSDYEPNNCEWASIAKQNRNRRNTVYIDIGDRILTRHEACRIFGTYNQAVIEKSRKYGISQQEAFNEIVLERGLRPEYRAR